MLILEDIKAAVAAVAKAQGAELACVFGSYARGTATEESDVDVIFVERTDQRFLDRLDRYLNPLIDRLKAGVEAFVYTPQEFEAMKDGPFVKQALNEGIIVYESGKV